MTHEEWYAQIYADNPDMDELVIRKNALTAANLDAALQEHRRKQVGVVRLVPIEKPTGGFVNALFGAVDTTGRMPVVRPVSQQEEAAR